MPENPDTYSAKPPKKENLESDANEALKDKALDYIRRYQNDGEELKQNRADALKAYRRDPYPEDSKIPDGSRSKFVMSDLSDCIESILPSLARIFTSGKEVVKIEGRGPEDTVGAELLNNKVNWDITVQNNGFLLFHDWFKAALLFKEGVVKYWWESKDETVEENYDGVTGEEGMILSQDQRYIIDEAEQIQPEMPPPSPDMIGMMVPPQPTFNIKGRRIKKRIRRPVAQLIPSEELVANIKRKNIKDEDFVAHRIKIHKTDLMADYDLSEADIDNEAENLKSLTEYSDDELYERFKDLGGVGFFQDEDDEDYYYIYECCMKETRKKGGKGGKGEGERRQPVTVTIMGNRMIQKQDNTYYHPNYCELSPIRMPHRAIGHSIYDMVHDLQKLDTALARYLMNNIYYQTENMKVVNPWKTNMADFLTQQRPGGIIRTKAENVLPQECVFPLPPQPLAGHAFGLLETINSWKEKRTGVTSYNQGLDSDSLNKTARGISEIMAASQQRLEMIARIFAETGVRDLMTAFAEMNIEFLDIETNVRLDQRWLEIPDPKVLDVLFDTTVDVALGTGSREMKTQQLLSMVDRALNPIMIQSGIIQPPNLYEMWRTVFIEMGYKNTEKYLTDPRMLQPMMPPQPGMMPGAMPNEAAAMDGGLMAGPGAGAPAWIQPGPPTIQ